MKEVLQERVSAAGEGAGIVVGIVDETGTRLYSEGKTGRAEGGVAGGDTVFEIGSVTKVFTSLVLAAMVEKGEVKLEDPISKFLPKSVRVPTRGGKEITLIDLATHSSGLPRLPSNMGLVQMLWHRDNPYANYTVQDLYDFLSSYSLPRDIGSRYEYSNVGGGLLGHVLALKAGTNYETMVLERVCRPLGMTNTEITLSSGLKGRLAVGHNEAGKAVANWDLPALAGAGALRSTANDLVKFVSANLGLTNTSLRPALEMAQVPRRPAGSASMQIGLGWHIVTKNGAEFVWHNGGTGGYHSFVGLDKKKKFGVVVLINSARSVDDLGFELLTGAPRK